MSEHKRAKAFHQGAETYRAGQPRESCSLPRGTIYFDDWNDGFEEASQKAPQPTK